MSAAPLDADDKIVENELGQFWLRPGERLLLGCPPIPGYVGAHIGDQIRVPHEPIGAMPHLTLDRPRWPLPAEATVCGPDVDSDWVDDPTLGYWVSAPHQDTIAVRLGDHFAHSGGEARIALSDQRVAVVYPTKLFHPDNPKPPTVFTTHAEVPTGHLTGLDAPFAGHSLPTPRVIRLRFADNSTLHLRTPHAANLVTRAHHRSGR
ncbi:hypothetical protein [Actinokineospora iranica]|uniref:Uncharacterized protein n=1 Tax=Actinokineospora iranica TaxID=1271860 RepID=A0A1G6NZL2_9PSEU|nr:hypothetical protein [Actinokineospora iranica]SDC73382.1 hypothetical protein SAMN05216174_10440 [Actinokineospora iranica]